MGVLSIVIQPSIIPIGPNQPTISQRMSCRCAKSVLYHPPPLQWFIFDSMRAVLTLTFLLNFGPSLKASLFFMTCDRLHLPYILILLALWACLQYRGPSLDKSTVAHGLPFCRLQCGRSLRGGSRREKEFISIILIFFDWNEPL